MHVRLSGQVSSGSSFFFFCCCFFFDLSRHLDRGIDFSVGLETRRQNDLTIPLRSTDAITFTNDRHLDFRAGEGRTKV